MEHIFILWLGQQCCINRNIHQTKRNDNPDWNKRYSFWMDSCERMIFIKKVLSDIILYNESLDIIKLSKDSSFVVKDDRVLIYQNKKLIMDIPYSCTGILI